MFLRVSQCARQRCLTQGNLRFNSISWSLSVATPQRQDKNGSIDIGRTAEISCRQLLSERVAYTSPTTLGFLPRDISHFKYQNIVYNALKTFSLGLHWCWDRTLISAMMSIPPNFIAYLSNTMSLRYQYWRSSPRTCVALISVLYGDRNGLSPALVPNTFKGWVSSNSSISPHYQRRQVSIIFLFLTRLLNRPPVAHFQLWRLNIDSGVIGYHILNYKHISTPLWIFLDHY